MSDPKYPVERADLTRLPWRALAVVAKVIESGDKKYHQGDWIMAPERVDGRRDLASALRHIGEYVEGQDVDEDSGESPLAHAAARLLFLLEREARGIKGGGWRIGQPTERVIVVPPFPDAVRFDAEPGTIVAAKSPSGEAWDPLADRGKIAREINRAPCTYIKRGVRGRWFVCDLESGHSGDHRFTIPYSGTE